MFIGMFIGQMVSVSWFNYLHLREGFFTEIGWTKKSCQAKSHWSYWGNKLILIDTNMWRQYLNIHRSDGFGILIKLSSSERGLLRRDRLNQKILSSEEPLVVLRQQINFDRYQHVKAVFKYSSVRRIRYLN